MIDKLRNSDTAEEMFISALCVLAVMAVPVIVLMASF